MRTRKVLEAALLVAALGGLAVANEREQIPEKVRAAAAKLFKGEARFSQVAAYEVKGQNSEGREVSLLITETGAAFRLMLASAESPPAAGARAFLGIRFASAEEATVAGTIEGTAAEKAGLKTGDRIVQVAEKSIGSATELAETLGAYRPGQKVKLVVERDGWRKALEVTLGARPANLDDDGDDEDGDHDESREHHEKGQKHDERGEHHGKGQKDDDDD
jgi:predicted metalloprotease with PDZ domain